MESGALDWLTHWYENQCNGLWEHAYGIAIGTIDNPGWSLKIELSDTTLDGKTLDCIENNYEHETEWWTCWTENNQFHGAGGPQQLAPMIKVFRDWSEET